MQIMNEIFILFLILLLNIFFKLLFAISKSTDDYTSLWMMNHIEEIIRFKKIKNSLINGKVIYPVFPLFIVVKIAKLLKNNNFLFIGKIMNIFYDSCLIVIIFLFYKFLIFDYWNLNINEYKLFWIIFLFSITPIFYPINARLKAVSGRVLGNLLLNLYMIILFFYKLYNIKYLLIILLFLIILILISSQFFNQALFFISILMSIFFMDISYILILVFGYFFALILPFLKVRQLLWGKYEHFKWYVKDKALIKDRNKIKDLVLLPYYIFKKFKKAFYIFFYKNSFLIIMYELPILLVFVLNINEYYYFFKLNKSDFVFQYLNYWVLAVFIIFLITSLKPFLFLGQAERYWEVGVAPLVILFFYFMEFKDKYIFLITILNLISIFLVYFALMGKNILNSIQGKKEEEFIDLINYLKKLKSKNIITLPVELSHEIDNYVNQHNYYYEFIYKNEGLNYLEKDLEIYNFFTSDIKYLKKSYNIELFIFDKRYLFEFAKENTIDYSIIIKLSEKIFENSKYIIYEI